MEGTADYSFSIGTDFIELCKGNKDLGTIYMACLVNVATSSEYSNKSSVALSKNAKEVFLDYCAKKTNNVKYNKAIKKALKKRQ